MLTRKMGGIQARYRPSCFGVAQGMPQQCADRGVEDGGGEKGLKMGAFSEPAEMRFSTGKAKGCLSAPV